MGSRWSGWVVLSHTRGPQPLFEHLPEVLGEVRAARHMLLGLDFDGTLAPIVPRPAEAHLPDETRTVLDALTSRPDVTLAIVSGRALSNLSELVGNDMILAGNHGLEIGGNGFVFTHPQAAALQSTVERISGEIFRLLEGIEGALVEDKRLTATVHFRNAAETDKDEIASIVRNVVRPCLAEFELRSGKESFEIRPRVQWNKGSAMLWLRDRLAEKRVAAGDSGTLLLGYIGDDATDEDAFRAITGITVRVGKHGRKNRPTAARFQVHDPAEVTGFLRWLVSTGLTPLPRAEPRSA